MGENIDHIIKEFPKLPEEKPHIICYIDFLGSKETMQKAGQRTFFENIHDAFAFAIMFQTHLNLFANLKIKVFSDNVLIAHEVASESDKGGIVAAYKNIELFLKGFAPRFVQQGILFRGGITLGSLAINEIMVWGSGLVEAVKLEENIAIYPRIVLGDKLVNVFMEYELDEYELEEKFSCLRDTDGCMFFDYINYSEPPTSEVTIKEGYMVILEKIKEEKSPKILQKYMWHKNYLKRAKNIHNECCGEYFYIDLQK